LRTNGVDRVTILSGGNVGIGTGTAVETLQVEGNVALSGANRFVGTTTATGLGLRTNNLNRVFIDGNGSIGIGTNSPSVQLDLSGAMRFTNSSVVSYVPSSINYYEEHSFTPTWVIGAGASSASIIYVGDTLVRCVRIGKLVTVSVPLVYLYSIGTTPSFYFTLPERFRPVQVEQSFAIRFIDNIAYFGLMLVRSNGRVEFYRSASGDGFPGGSGTSFTAYSSSFTFVTA
jgi:hypothetical protein